MPPSRTVLSSMAAFTRNALLLFAIYFYFLYLPFTEYEPLIDVSRIGDLFLYTLVCSYLLARTSFKSLTFTLLTAFGISIITATQYEFILSFDQFYWNFNQFTTDVFNRTESSTIIFAVIIFATYTFLFLVNRSHQASSYSQKSAAILLFTLASLLLPFLSNESISPLSRIGIAKAQEQHYEQAQHTIYRVAHACGAIRGIPETNSLEALTQASHNFRLIEIDFSKTKDGHYVALHDWHSTFTKLFGHPIDSPIDLAEYTQLSMRNSLTPLTFSDVAAFLDHHDGIYIVTDVKGDNIEALRHFSQQYKNATTRLIPQIYFPIEYGPIKRMGYRNVIFTLYAYKRKDDTSLIAKYSKHFDYYAITAPSNYCTPQFTKLISKSSKRIYAHTVNSIDQLHQLKENGVSEVYTDFIVPPER